MSIKNWCESKQIRLGFPRDWEDSKVLRRYHVLRLVESALFLVTLGYVSADWSFYCLLGKD